MSFLSILKTIGTDIEKGISIAAPIVGTFVPDLGPILSEISQVITALETSKSTTPSTSITVPTPTPEQVSTVIQQVTAAHVIKQSLGVKT